MNKRTEETIYDVDSYTDKELYDILDLNNPTDRELEAKILFLIRKYENIQNDSGNTLASFFKKIHNRFFYIGEENEETIETLQTSQTLQETNPTKKEYINPFENPPLRRSQFLGNTEKKQIPPVQEGMSNKGTSNEETVKEGMSNEGMENNEEVKLTKTLDYSAGKTNPLLQQTIKRIVSIDSQYRENKKDLATNFTFNLSEPLKDVVSLKLYSIQIPYTWYTISTHYGSNIFYLKGNAPGINQGYNDYGFSIAPGNYTPSQLADTVNESIQQVISNYTDISFGKTNIFYNKYTSLTTFTVDITQQFNETSYYLSFPASSWKSPSNATNIRIQSIPSLLGYNFLNYEPYKVRSNYASHLIKDTQKNDLTERSYELDGSNNYFTVYKYIGPSTYAPNSSQIDLSFTVFLSLAKNNKYTLDEIVTDVSNQIANTNYLSNDYSYIKRFDLTDSSFNNNTCYFELALKTNRFTTNNNPYSKLYIAFPNETYITPPSLPIWTGSNSCFQFDASYEMNSILSETPAIEQINTLYSITTSPTITLTCTKPGFDVSTNNFIVTVPNTINTSYKLREYIDAINTGINTTISQAYTQNNYNIFYKNNTTAFLDQPGYFNVQFDLTKNITQNKFTLYFNGYLDVNNNYYTRQQVINNYGVSSQDLDELQRNNTVFSTLNLHQIGFMNSTLNYPNEIDLSLSNTFQHSFAYATSYTINTKYLACVRATNPGDDISGSLSYNILTPPNSNDKYYLDEGYNPSILIENLQPYINKQFSTYKDADGIQIFKGSTFTVSGTNSSLTLFINKPLTQLDYNIQFNDISNINQTQFVMDISGYVDNSNNYISDSAGINTYTLKKVGGLRDLCFNSIEYNCSAIIKSGSFLLPKEYRFDMSYIALIRYNANEFTDTTNYLIPAPPGNYKTIYDSSKVFIMNQLKNDMTACFTSYPDLSGTTVDFSVTNQYVSIIINVVINQKSNYKNTSWYKNLNISPSMIQNPYPLNTLNTINNLSYQGTSYSGVQSYKKIEQQSITFDNTNNTFQIIPFEQGVSTRNNQNTITITIPRLDANGDNIIYNLETLVSTINTLIQKTDASGSVLELVTIGTNRYSRFRLSINKEYTAKDYNIVFYDQISFVSCYVGVSSVRNTTWDATLGWILGFRLYTVYNLSKYTTGIIVVTGDTGVSTNLYNYFLICLNDFNQNHLNDGLVTVTGKQASIPLPSYASRSNYICNPVTHQRSYNTTLSTDYKKLTQNQIYSLTQIANAQYARGDATTNSVSASSYGSGPFVQDVFGIIPAKTAGLANGSSYVEFGGTLQNQERLYFGPVNISRMNVQLVSDRGDVIDLNGANWSFSLICEQLYNK